MEGNSNISNCYATALINSNGGTPKGGLVGEMTAGVLANSYYGGFIQGGGASDVGGVVGAASGGATVNDSFWDVEVSGVGVSAGGVGKTTAEMQMQATFDPPFDFVNVWSIDEGSDYPRLQTTPFHEPDLPDCDFNGVPDTCDLDPNDPDGDGLVAADCQPNGVPDDCDIALGTERR